jgi:hypothetical protein
MSNKWKWHEIIHLMISELNTTEEKVYKKNYISVLNWLSYFYERNKIREAEMKKQK